MFTEVQIENYKSIQSLKIGLGRVNVFIGENGCGKSNILEAIALAGAAAGNKLDNEFLAPRGIRVTEPEFMRSAFDKENITKEIKVNLRTIDQAAFNYEIKNDNKPFSKWYSTRLFHFSKQQVEDIIKDTDSHQKLLDSITKLLNNQNDEYEETYNPNAFRLRDFLIYSPENSMLRTFEKEGQIQPLGINGEGLFKLIKVLSYSPRKLDTIKQKLQTIDWFDNFKIHQNSDIERNIQIKDRYLDKELPYFNQRSSNEGFLFLMFYFALFVSDDTPKFFAIDNIENALNPKLCTRLIQELVELAKKYDKQVIFTTHNPAVLDGLDLQDDEQRLFTIYRNIDGHTKAKRVYAPESLDDDEPVPLSEAFMNGYIGGLPNNF
ncbi:AAA family ATPase [Pseudanabaena minima]|uniref:AAA family ATPase n=1 Tax=Pseudanabaena minima TaxID=890415 RepID=UPI003DA85151